MIRLFTLIGVFFLIGLNACHINTRLSPVFIGGWKENHIGFVNSIPHKETKGEYLEFLMDLKWSNGGVFCTWIRKPMNLLITHNTLKKVGYKNFISGIEFHQPLDFFGKFGGMRKHHWEGMSISQVLDSLIVNYKKPTTDNNYFSKFWKRRISDSTDGTVIFVLSEIKEIYENKNGDIKKGNEELNDTIQTLLNLDLKLQAFNKKPTGDFLWEYFIYLKSIGLDQSAYNLVIEEYPGKISLDTVVNILKLDTVSEEVYWNTRNNGTWINTYDDNGP